MPRTTVDSLITHGRILTVDAINRIVDDGAVAISGGRIIAVGGSGELESAFQPAQRIDCQGGIVHPGFIDAHIHVSQYTARSVLPRMASDTVNMGDWKAALEPRDETASAMLAALDYLRCGYTGFVDPGTVFEPDAVAGVSGATGIRIWLTDPYVADLGHRLAGRLPELASPEFLARWPRNTGEAIERLGGQLFRNRESDSRVRGFIGLYGESTASAQLLRKASAVAKAAGVQLQMHLGYRPSTYRAEEQALQCQMLDHLAANDCLAPHVTLVHMNVVRSDEIVPLREAKVRIVWCPWGQLQAIGSGDAEPRMVEMLRAGIAVGLATDIPRTCNFDDLGALAATAATASGMPIADHELLRARTLDAAATVGAESELGSIEVGKIADLVIRVPTASEDLGASVMHEAAMLLERTSVKAVLIGGETVFADGRMKRIDDSPIIDEARKSVQRILRKIRMSRDKQS